MLFCHKIFDGHWTWTFHSTVFTAANTDDNFLGIWNIRSLSNKSGYKRRNKWNLVFRYVCSTFMKYKWIPGYFINALTLSTFFICNKSVCWLHLKWKNVYNASKRVWAFLWKMGMKLWKYQHQWAKEGLCVGGSVRLLSSSRSYYLAVSNLFYIILRLTPYSSGDMSVVYIISSKDRKFSQLADFIIASMCFVQASLRHEMSLYEGVI